VIDDCDNGSCFLPGINGRSGQWYSFDDGSNTPDGGVDPLTMVCNAPVSGGAPGSTMALEVSSVVGFSGFAGVGVALDAVGSTSTPYDVSAYTGVAFWAKGNSDLNFRFLMTDNSQWGSSVYVTSSWQQFVIPISSLALEYSTSEAGALDPKEVTTLQFGILSKSPFDVLIEDVGFY
jgi:Complex I intermediate-associated protein 30 (CIA30)